MDTMLLRKFIDGPGIDEPICLVDGADANEIYYYHFDGLGSVVALSDVNNVLAERYAYDVFGRPTLRDANGAAIDESGLGNPYLFTGRRYDVEAGLYYYRARYYDYYAGRFLQPDPLGYVDGPNMYAYVGNNPGNRLDPLGLRYYSEAETAKIINDAATQAGGGIIRGPWGAFGIGGDFDFKILQKDSEFVLPGHDLMIASEFGNYLAGYACTYNYGERGTLGAKIAGDIFALADTLDISRSTGPWTGYILDDPGSTYWINRGAKDANLRRMREIFGPDWGRDPDDIVAQQVGNMFREIRENHQKLMCK